ncbi:MAG: hypothetical protein WC992_01215 [Acholeplasmataceae bacterium]|jgi:hypothetical protein|nr:hypothetical protein [Acholeplasmataceae bacterium]
MPILYISLGLLLIAFIIYIILTIHHKKVSDHIKNTTQDLLKTYGELTHKHHHQYLNINNQSYQILYFYVPVNAELTINSKIIWEIRDSSKSRLINQTSFLASSDPKIIIVYPTTLSIKRFINENEMEFVNYHTMFNQMYVIRHFELEKLLQELKDA